MYGYLLLEFGEFFQYFHLFGYRVWFWLFVLSRPKTEMNVLIRGIAHIMRKLYRTHSLRYLGYGLNELTSGIQNRLKHITIYDYDGNLKISMDPFGASGKFNFSEGTMNSGTYRLLKSLIKPNDVIVEVGSNIGIWTILFCKMATAGLVYAIEPSSFELLKKNLAFKQLFRMLSSKK